MLTQGDLLLVDGRIGDEPRLVRAARERHLELTITPRLRDAMQLCEQRAFNVVCLGDDLDPQAAIAFLLRLATVRPLCATGLYCSAPSFELVARAVTDAGARFVIPKPCPAEAVIDVLARACEQGRERIRERARVHEQKSLNRELMAWTAHIEESFAAQQEKLLESLLDALSQKNPALLSHGRRVARFAGEIATSLGVESSTRRAVVEAAFLHDLSTIGVPDHILFKPGPLSDVEWPIIRSHIEVGRRLLGEACRNDAAHDVFVQHHERWDGSGYPHGTAGADICPGARIFAVADALDAMLSERPYRPAMTLDRITPELARCAGSQFDPEVIAAFTRLPASTWTAAAHDS